MSFDQNMSELAPIVLFAYNRPIETAQTIEALKKNYLAESSCLYIFSDGPKGETDLAKVQETRAILRSVVGFKNVQLFESQSNKGLADSVIDGVSKIMSIHSKVIVLEDDLITSANFLDFMNQALVFYTNNNSVISVSGFTLPLKGLPIDRDFYTGYRASSWTWGTWRRVWEEIDWELAGVEKYLNDRKLMKRFNRGGSDMNKMLNDQIRGRINSWAIRFCFHQFINNFVTIFPTTSKALNIGFGEDATHTTHTTRFFTQLDTLNKRDFSFDNHINVNAELAKSFRVFYSIRLRIADRLRKYATNITNRFS